MAKNDKMTQGIFQGKVLEKLENIEEQQVQHNITFKDVFEKINNQDKKISTAEGFAKGALVVGSLGFGGGIISWIKGLF